MDSLLQVVQSVENWKDQFQEALDNPLRKQYTEEKLRELRLGVEAILEMQVDSPELHSRLESISAKLHRAPN
jgi:hypothetical protein